MTQLSTSPPRRQLLGSTCQLLREESSLLVAHCLYLDPQHRPNWEPTFCFH